MSAADNMDTNDDTFSVDYFELKNSSHHPSSTSDRYSFVMLSRPHNIVGRTLISINNRYDSSSGLIE